MLSPSSAHRWLACTPSAKLEYTLPDKTSEAAEEGTLAHSLVELRLQNIIKGKPRGSTPAKAKNNPLWKPVMDGYVDAYVDFVQELYQQELANETQPILYSERNIRFDEYVPDGHGTTDTVIIADHKMIVIDFKYGKGVPVSAVNNPQLRLYAIGAFNDFDILYDIESVTTYIFQPRVDGGSITTETLTVEELLDWAEKEVKPKALMALHGEGEAVQGDHCRFCRAKTLCITRLKSRLDAMINPAREPGIMTPDELAQVLPVAEELVGWAKEIKEFMLDQSVNNGVSYPGYKVVQGRSNRTISDEIKAAGELMKAGYKDIYELKSLTKLEDEVGKKELARLIGSLIVKPEGKPTLVPESDARPAINGEQMFNDGKGE